MYTDEKIFISSIVEVLQGQHILKRIQKKYHINFSFDWILILFKGNDNANYHTLLYLNQLIKQIEKNKKTCREINMPVYEGHELYTVITDDVIIKKSAEYICRRLDASILVSEKEIQKIGRYCCILRPSNHLILGISDKLHIGYGIKNLLSNGITIEDIVANGIFHLEMDTFDESICPSLPAYNGKDQDIRDFIMKNDMRATK